MSYAGAVKDRHIEACLREPVEEGTNGFERYRLLGDLPDFRYDEIDTSCEVFGRKLAVPFLISSLTGGGRRSETINRRLAEAAATLQIGMSVGSQKLMLQHPELKRSFEVRRWAPGILLFANLGLVHLNDGLTEEGCLRAVQEIGADALILYVNPLHEVLQARGSLDFRGLLGRLRELSSRFPYPIVVKEVGYGFSEPALLRLAGAGISGLDVAGKGGTDWSKVERALGRAHPVEAFAELGVPTAEGLAAAARLLPKEILLFASGGIRNGVETAKAVAMGARCVGLGLPFLRWAANSTDRVIEEVKRLTDELRVAMWYAAAPKLGALLGRVSPAGDGSSRTRGPDTTVPA
jgi:isopentenyl-diphosphate Delta-isomerase